MKHVRTRKAAAIILAFLLAATLTLGGCGIPFSPRDLPSDDENSAENQANRERAIIESKVNRYFKIIRDDRESLTMFVNHMPKGADVRVRPSVVNVASAAGDTLPFTGDEYRALLVRAASQHITYLQIIANLTSEQIEELDTVQTRLLPDSGAGVTVNFLAAVSCDLTGATFEQELLAAITLCLASDRVVGITLLPATTEEGAAEFYRQMAVIDGAYTALAQERFDEYRTEAPHEVSTGGTTTQDAAAHETNTEVIEENDTPLASGTNEETAGNGEVQEPLLHISIPIDAYLMTHAVQGDGYHYIRAALEQGHATRIEYGASIAHEDDAYDLLTRMVDENIGVVVLPVPLSNAPDPSATDTSTFALFTIVGISVALASDGGVVQSNDMTAAFVQMVRAHDMSYKELKQLSYASIDVSDLSAEERKELRAALDDSFRAFEKDMAQHIDDLGLLTPGR